MESQTLLDALARRYAAKKYDPSKKLTRDQITTLTEVLRLSPSGFGLEPWKFIVIENPELRTQLRAASHGQPQVTDASHLIVFAAKKNITAQDIDEYMELIATTRSIPLESLNDFKASGMASFTKRDEVTNLTRSQKQTYIALGFLLEAAALLKIDASPMEGFVPAEYDRILGLTDYTTSVIAAVGYRASDDMFEGFKKVRKSRDAVIDIRS